MAHRSAARKGLAVKAICNSLGVLALLAAPAGCGSKPEQRPVEVTPVVTREVAPVLRGTIGSEVTFRGVSPFLVSGYGLVVGLKGTGGGLLDERIASTMERELSLRGVGSEDFRDPRNPLAGKSPRQVLADKNVAVVQVLAAISPGAAQGHTFDVFVQALNATSLEGGTLWTTELRLGSPTSFGSVKSRVVARARGPIFINPFAEPGKENTGVSRNVGRILDGGLMTNPLGIEMVLDNASHGRARAVVSAINSRFPQAPGDRLETARGRDASSIELRVPSRYRQKTTEFIELVRHLRIDPTAPEEVARRYVRELRESSLLARQLSWCLEAVGDPAKPFLRSAYDAPEVTARLAALRAGARLNDPFAFEPLAEIARNGPMNLRADAIRLLALIDAGPKVDLALRDLLAEKDLVIRIAAYEALAERATKAQTARLAAQQAASASPTAPRLSLTHLERIAAMAIPGGNMQGMQRETVAGKFLLDIVPIGDPLIYITQQREPRIVVFGQDTRLTRPLTLAAWDNRFILTTEVGAERCSILYQIEREGELRTVTDRSVPADISNVIRRLAYRSSADDPRPGFNMSYSEVVGLLYEISRGGGTSAAFATEVDRLRSELVIAAEGGGENIDRPETPEDREVVVLERTRMLESPAPAKPTPEDEPLVVPITPAAPKN